MAKLCVCLTGKTLEENIAILDKNRKHADLAELRVDCLDADERLFIRRFPEMAGLPVILSIRRRIDGGCFKSGEAARVVLLAKGLAYANADRRYNFAYVELEDDLNVPSLEEVARAFGTKIIRSHYGDGSVTTDLEAKLRSLKRIGDEIAKVRLLPRSLDDVRAIYQAAQKTIGTDKILFCQGQYGIIPTILAHQFGSLISYAFPRGQQELQHCDCSHESCGKEIALEELSDLYRVKKIRAQTRIFTVTGFPFTAPLIPRFFNSVFDIDKTDAVCLSIPADSTSSLLQLAMDMRISGIALTAPHKELVLPSLCDNGNSLTAFGSCTTIVPSPEGWLGVNTEAESFSGSLLTFLGKKDLRGVRLTIIGAGSSARTVAREVHRLNGKALIINRTVERARSLAKLYGFAWAALSIRSAPLVAKYSKVLIQTTPVGIRSDADPISFYTFSGKEAIMDFIWDPEKTQCLKRAEASGCRTLNGYDMMVRQLRGNYNHFMGKEFPLPLAALAGFLSRENTDHSSTENVAGKIAAKLGTYRIHLKRGAR